MQEQYKRLQDTVVRLIEVQQAVWFYYRPHLLSLFVSVDNEWTDDGYRLKYNADYHTIESESDDDLWLDEPFITTRKEPVLDFIHPYIDFSDIYGDFEEDLPPVALGLKEGQSVNLVNPNYTLEQIEALICEF